MAVWLEQKQEGRAAATTLLGRYSITSSPSIIPARKDFLKQLSVPASYPHHSLEHNVDRLLVLEAADAANYEITFQAEQNAPFVENLGRPRGI
jgi:hypothetical protein